MAFPTRRTSRGRFFPSCKCLAHAHGSTHLAMASATPSSLLELVIAFATDLRLSGA